MLNIRKYRRRILSNIRSDKVVKINGTTLAMMSRDIVLKMKIFISLFRVINNT